MDVSESVAVLGTSNDREPLEQGEPESQLSHCVTALSWGGDEQGFPAKSSNGNDHMATNVQSTKSISTGCAPAQSVSVEQTGDNGKPPNYFTASDGNENEIGCVSQPKRPDSEIASCDALLQHASTHHAGGTTMVVSGGVGADPIVSTKTDCANTASNRPQTPQQVLTPSQSNTNASRLSPVHNHNPLHQTLHSYSAVPKDTSSQSGSFAMASNEPHLLNSCAFPRKSEVSDDMHNAAKSEGGSHHISIDPRSRSSQKNFHQRYAGADQSVSSSALDNSVISSVPFPNIHPFEPSGPGSESATGCSTPTRTSDSVRYSHVGAFPIGRRTPVDYRNLSTTTSRPAESCNRVMFPQVPSHSYPTQSTSRSHNPNNNSSNTNNNNARPSVHSAGSERVSAFERRIQYLEHTMQSQHEEHVRFAKNMYELVNDLAREIHLQRDELLSLRRRVERR